MIQKNEIRRKKWKVVFFSFVFSLFFSAMYLNLNLYTFIQRDGNEHTELLTTDREYRQEIQLNCTSEINVGVLANYSDYIQTDAGILCKIEFDDLSLQQYIPLRELPKEQWGNISLDTRKLFFKKGYATLVIKGIKTDQVNNAQILLVDNKTQLNSNYKLYINNERQENTCININYNEWKLFGAIQVFLICNLIFVIFYFLRKKIRKILFNNYLYIIPCIIFIVNFIMSFSTIKKINKHISSQYLFSWQNLGFQKRSLIGTIIEFLHINFTQSRYIMLGIFLTSILFILEVGFIKWCEKRTSNVQIKKLIVFFSCTPFFSTIYFNYSFFARFDIFLIIFFAMTCAIIINGKYIWIIPILTIIASLIHEMYIPMYMPFVFFLLLYKYRKTKEVKYLFIVVITSLIAISLVTFISLGIPMRKSFEDAWSYIQNLYDKSLSWDFTLKLNYYVDPAVYAYENIYQMRLNKIWLLFMCSTILFIPILKLFFSWYKNFFIMHSAKMDKIIVSIYPLTIIGLLVCMFACDWGRWQAMYGTGMFFSFTTLWMLDKENVEKSVEKTVANAKEKYGEHILWVICVYYLLLTTICRGGGTTTLLGGILADLLNVIFYN